MRAQSVLRISGGTLGDPAGIVRRAYLRFGVAYPRIAVLVVLQLAQLNIALGVSALALYVDMSLGEYLRILVVALIGMGSYNVLYGRVARTELRPVREWLEGDRAAEVTVAAWRACATFPHEMLRREWMGRLAAIGYAGLLLWAIYASWELDFPIYALLALVAGMVPFVLYVQTLRFFTLERALRPVLDDLARAASGNAALEAPGLTLRTRLLAALPAINVITGFTAVGVTGFSHDLDPADMALALLVSVAMAATVSLALTRLLADSVTTPIDQLHEATRQLAGGDLTARVPVVTTDETGALARSFNEMAAGLEQRERLREAFGTFVDPQLTERVLEEGTDFAGEEVELSLLFMDVRGFTTYSETATAPEVVARLNDLYGEVVPVVLRQRGHANKFIGDGLLAVFGAPDRLPDHADRAVAAALEIARCVRARYGGELRVGIGVNTGPVVAGTIGGGGRLDFTVIGDAVNTAARVESATRQTDDDVLITEATLRALGQDGGRWLERSGVTLKGKTQEVRLYAPREGAA